MSLRVIKTFHVPKKGNRLDEYEDAYAIKEDASMTAISDGATEACFSKEWANLLVQHAITSPPKNTNIDCHWLHAPAEELLNQIDLEEKPWYVQNKFNQFGTAATLLALNIDEKAGLFMAVSVGDSCLFWMQKDTEFQSFPMNSHEEFTNTPYLINNRDDLNQEISNKQIKHFTVPLPKGRTLFYLMTDSLAEWVFRELSRVPPKYRKNPFRFLRGIEHNSRFQQIMYEKIDNKEIRNDDLTVIIVEAKIGEANITNYTKKVFSQNLQNSQSKPRIKINGIDQEALSGLKQIPNSRGQVVTEGNSVRKDGGKYKKKKNPSISHAQPIELSDYYKNHTRMYKLFQQFLQSFNQTKYSKNDKKHEKRD